MSWLYTMVSLDILNIILQPSDMASNVWSAFSTLFVDNNLQCIVYTYHKFHNLIQGELSITTYCYRLKCLTNILCDIGSPVTNHELLVNLIHGLNNAFGHCIAIITLCPKGLIFAKACNSLLIEERRLHHTTDNVH
jgi:hypothetical protein